VDSAGKNSCNDVLPLESFDELSAREHVYMYVAMRLETFADRPK